MHQIDPFRILSREERESQIASHRDFQRARDGELELPARRLSKREAFLEEIDARPVRWAGDFDRDGFHRGMAGDRGPQQDLRVTWLLAVARANVGEHYGVELELERFARNDFEGVDRHLLHVALEDRDHTRFLSRVCEVFGVPLELDTPGLVGRVVTRAMNYLPDALRFPLILCGEVTGAVFFRILLERCDLFAAEPEVEQRLRLLIGEIVTDETGHVAFCRARVEPALIGPARGLLPFVASALLRELPEFGRLAGGRSEVMRRIRAQLPVPEAAAWLRSEPAV